MTDQPVSAQGTAASTVADTAADRPEMVLGAAFAAGFTLALILKRLVR